MYIGEPVEFLVHAEVERAAPGGQDRIHFDSMLDIRHIYIHTYRCAYIYIYIYTYIVKSLWVKDCTRVDSMFSYFWPRILPILSQC